MLHEDSLCLKNTQRLNVKQWIVNGISHCVEAEQGLMMHSCILFSTLTTLQEA